MSDEQETASGPQAAETCPSDDRLFPWAVGLAVLLLAGRFGFKLLREWGFESPELEIQLAGAFIGAVVMFAPFVILRRVGQRVFDGPRPTRLRSEFGAATGFLGLQFLGLCLISNALTGLLPGICSALRRLAGCGDLIDRVRLCSLVRLDREHRGVLHRADAVGTLHLAEDAGCAHVVARAVQRRGCSGRDLSVDREPAVARTGCDGSGG
jgi:hypothetical protein